MSRSRDTYCECGKPINPECYTTKGNRDFCSDRCAEKFGNKEIAQKSPDVSLYTGEWPTAPVPS